MKKLTLTIAIVISGMFIQAQSDKAITIARSFFEKSAETTLQETAPPGIEVDIYFEKDTVVFCTIDSTDMMAGKNIDYDAFLNSLEKTTGEMLIRELRIISFKFKVIGANNVVRFNKLKQI